MAQALFRLAASFALIFQPGGERLPVLRASVPGAAVSLLIEAAQTGLPTPDSSMADLINNILDSWVCFGSRGISRHGCESLIDGCRESSERCKDFDSEPRPAPALKPLLQYSKGRGLRMRSAGLCPSREVESILDLSQQKLIAGAAAPTQTSGIFS